MVALLGIAIATTAGLVGCGTSPPRSEPRTVVLDIHYSSFSTSSLTVGAGEIVRFVVRNHDPIAHELIVGDETVQDNHERGTEAHHASRPGEISVAPGATATTTYTFLARDVSSSPVLFGCHLPGHWAYGMRGTVTVR